MNKIELIKKISLKEENYNEWFLEIDGEELKCNNKTITIDDVLKKSEYHLNRKDEILNQINDIVNNLSNYNKINDQFYCDLNFLIQGYMSIYINESNLEDIDKAYYAKINSIFAALINDRFSKLEVNIGSIDFYYISNAIFSFDYFKFGNNTIKVDSHHRGRSNLFNDLMQSAKDFFQAQKKADVIKILEQQELDLINNLENLIENLEKEKHNLSQDIANKIIILKKIKK